MKENELKINVLEHEFVPKHELVSDKEEQEVLKKYGIEKTQLPKILRTDPAIKHLTAKRHMVIKITRESKTAGKSIYYRIVA